MVRHSFSSCPSHDNISDSFTDPSQVLRIDCDAPTTTEQTTYQRITSDPMTSNDSITTSTYLQTTDSLQSTTKRTKGDGIANDQITGNIIGISDSSMSYNVCNGCIS